MISNAEIERYREFALLLQKPGATESEINLALMVTNLIEVIDHLCTVLQEKAK